VTERAEAPFARGNRWDERWAKGSSATRLEPVDVHSTGQLVRATLLAGALSVLTSGCKPAASAGDANAHANPDLLPRDPAVHEEVLDSGVTYISQRGQSESGLVNLRLVVRVGTGSEREQERGFAHLVEHLAFSGTEHFPKEELRQFIGWQGMTINRHTSGRTEFAYTVYGLDLAGGEPNRLDRGMLVLREWAAGMEFAAPVVEAEQRVIRAETIHRSGWLERYAEELRQLRTTGSTLTESGDGRKDDAWEHATPAQLQSFYRRWYQPQNLAVVVAGPFDPDDMRDLVVEHFGDLPQPPQPSVPVTLEAHPPAEKRLTTLDAPDAPADRFVVAARRSVRPVATRADHRESLIDRLVARMIQQRLERSSYRPESPIFLPNADLDAGPDLLRIEVTPRAGAMTRAAGEVLLELKRLEQHRFVGEELDPARRWLQVQRASDRSLAQGIGPRLDTLTEHFVDGTALVSFEQQELLDRQVLSSVALPEVNQQLDQWLQAQRHFMVVANDARDRLTESDVEGLVVAAREAAVEPYRLDPVPSRLMPSPPAPVKIREETPGGEGVWVWNLNNGARVVFKPTHYDVDKVSLLAFGPGGTAQSPRPEVSKLRLSVELVDWLGFGDYSAREVKLALSSADVTLNSWISSHEHGLKATSSSAGLPLLFQAIHQRLSTPRPDDREFASLQDLYKIVRAFEATPSQFFENEMERQLWEGHPEHVPPDAPTVEQLDAKSAVALYRERFARAGALTFVIVGSAHLADTRQLVEQYLATLPDAPKGESAPAPGAQRRPGITRVRVQRGTADEARVVVSFHGSGPLPKQARLELDALRFYLHLRLLESLRGRLGNVYTVDTRYELDEPPAQGYQIGFSFDCPPASAEALKRAALDVVEEMKRSDATPAIVSELKQQRTWQARARLTVNQFWLDELVNAHRRGEDPWKIPVLWKADTGLGGEDLKRSAQRYLRSDQYVDAILMPEVTAGGG
jgi:zinc protease